MFVYFQKDEQSELRHQELYHRCLVARHRVEDASDIVIGIGLNEYAQDRGTATDVIYVEVLTSNDDWRHEAKRIEDESGYFKRSSVRLRSEDEFPVE